MDKILYLYEGHHSDTMYFSLEENNDVCEICGDSDNLIASCDLDEFRYLHEMAISILIYDYLLDNEKVELIDEFLGYLDKEGQNQVRKKLRELESLIGKVLN